MSNDIILEQSDDIDPNPDRLTFLPIDPFAARPGVASRVVGLGGSDLGGEPGYVFQSLEIYPVLGPVRFTLQFHNLVATIGTLVVRVHAISAYPGTASMLLKSVRVPLCDIVGNSGFFSVEILSRRNMIYTIGGTIENETNATASALSLSLDPREREAPLPCADMNKKPVFAPIVSRVEKLLERPELATMRPSLLARPVSQAMTNVQLCDPLVSAWNAVLHQPEDGEIKRWENAFILQALDYYGVAADTGSALGIGCRSSRLPSYFAGRGCTILAAATRRDDLPGADPGLALEHLAYADLCTPRRFFEAVHLTMFEDLVIPAGLTGFDFLWSTDASGRLGDRSHFPQMLRDSIGCLRLGGLAIHMLRYSGEVNASTAPGSISYGRAEIERMALSLIADGQEVAQLKFDVDVPDSPGDRAMPFALIARRVK